MNIRQCDGHMSSQHVRARQCVDPQNPFPKQQRKGTMASIPTEIPYAAALFTSISPPRKPCIIASNSVAPGPFFKVKSSPAALLLAAYFSSASTQIGNVDRMVATLLTLQAVPFTVSPVTAASTP